MPLFHFNLRARGRVHHDSDGTDLPDLAAARDHAGEVARDLLRYCEDETRRWSLCVENEKGERQFDLFFADVDPSLASYSPQLRLLVRETCRRFGALTDALCAARAARTESRMLFARSRGKPQLVYARNE